MNRFYDFLSVRTKAKQEYVMRLWNTDVHRAYRWEDVVEEELQRRGGVLR